MNGQGRLVIYDSAYGNTEKVAHVIAGVLGAEAVLVQRVTPEQLRGLDLLVIGSPTQTGHATANLAEFMKQLPEGKLRGVHVAAFDTRFDPAVQKRGLKLLMRVIGYAAEKIDRLAAAKGATRAGKPTGFIVQETEGPLRGGELERAADWAKKLIG